NVIRGVLLIAAAAAIAVVVACGRSSKPHVLFVGIDGATWDVMTPMIERGELPNFKALIERGVASPLRTFQPSLSPIIWTSIATGKTMDKHGITSFVHADDPNSPIRSNERRASAVWEILGDGDVRVGIVGWWLTWPAEHVNGFMVSSYAAIAAGLWKGSVYSGIPEQVYPARLNGDLEALIGREQARAADVSRDIFGALPPDYGNPIQQRVIFDTKSAALTDRIFFEATREFGKREEPDFLAVYWGAVDVASHRFWKYFRPTDLPFHVSTSDIAALKEVVPNSYRWADARLGELVAAAGPDTTVIVASDHGFHAETVAYATEDERSGGHEDARVDLPGILVAAGPGIRHADWRASPPARLPSVFDVTPTLLYIYGLPVAYDMDGTVCLDLFDLEFVKTHKVEHIATYEDRAKSRRGSASADPGVRQIEEGIRNRMKSIGYLAPADNTQQPNDSNSPPPKVNGK
ncbi:MAG: alkaline phosphatase family protein, partial [Planctomycetes bacterium]|nr:alkaline phosphatase family protein [Planctomycetota bacterium]